MFKKSMIAILACGFGVGLFIGCGGGGSSAPSGDDGGGGDTTTKAYKSLIFTCNLNDGLLYDICKYDIASNAIERLKNSESNIVEFAEGDLTPVIEDLIIVDEVLYVSGYDNQYRTFAKYTPVIDNAFVDIEVNGGSPKSLTFSNDALYFVTKNDTNIGRELYKYDIATNKVSLAADINKGSGDSDIKYINVIDDVLYFSASDGSPHIELWKYDTATDKAEMAVEVYLGNPSSFVDYIINKNGTLYFAAIGTGVGLEDYNLWSYNPSTETLSNLSKTSTISLPLGLKDKGVLTEADNIIYFQGRNESLIDKGYELYKYDIAQNKISLAADINKTTGGDSSSSPVELTAAHGYLYFSADDDVHGRELWKLDLATEQVSMAIDINPDGKNSHSNPCCLVEVNDVLYFSADDGVNGRELYKCTKEDGCSITRNMNGPNNTLPISNANIRRKIIGSHF